MTEVTPPASDGHRALNSPKISFEFFPPKTEEMERRLWETIKRLAPLSPNFVSVTYGAGGSTRERTHSTIARILEETSLTPAAHLTCVGAARGEIDDIVARYHEIGVRHIVALRGDPPGRHRHGLHAASRRLSDLGRPRRRHQEALSRHRGLGLGLSGKASGEPATSTPTSTCCRPRSMPARPAPSPRCSSTTISTSATSTGSAPAASTSRSCPASCRCTISSRRAISSPAPAPRVPDWLAEKFEGPRRRRRNPQAGGRDRRGGPGAEAGKARRRHLPFLHHEPRGPRVRDQPFARHSPQWRTESRLIR